METLEELGVDTTDLTNPETETNVVFIMQSGKQIGVSTFLSPEDIMLLWNKRGSTLKIPTGENHSYVVIKKRRVDFLHAF